ncbi:hypothetical protein niasHT_040137 [Heterodera trifolii]|uniref:Chromo domain-containing protein n=1 Tax=Heterodera trifolii TaxID=157864 RepID=A0ABD2HX47_9BILA
MEIDPIPPTLDHQTPSPLPFDFHELQNYFETNQPAITEPLEAFPLAPQQIQGHVVENQQCTDDIFEVNNILAHRTNLSSGMDEWLVRWVGFEVADATWETQPNFLGSEAVQMLNAFEMERNYKIVEIKVGEQFKYENVPGKLMVKRQIAATNDPQYLFVGQTAWTTNGTDRYGYAELDFATGTMIIPNFSENDFGSYTFPLEKSSLNAGNVQMGQLEDVGKTKLELTKKE